MDSRRVCVRRAFDACRCGHTPRRSRVEAIRRDLTTESQAGSTCSPMQSAGQRLRFWPWCPPLLRVFEEVRQGDGEDERNPNPVQDERRIAPLLQRDDGLSIEQRIRGPQEFHLHHVTILRSEERRVRKE